MEDDSRGGGSSGQSSRSSVGNHRRGGGGGDDGDERNTISGRLPRPGRSFSVDTSIALSVAMSQKSSRDGC